MTETEKLMYQLMGAMESENIPIVFKGAMITNLILIEKGGDHVLRETRDIDGSWYGKSPSMELITEKINLSLNRVNGNFYEYRREHS